MEAALQLSLKKKKKESRKALRTWQQGSSDSPSSSVPDRLASSFMLSSHGFSLQLNSASSLQLCTAVDGVLRQCYKM